jgi:integrase/recombinase XerD
MISTSHENQAIDSYLRFLIVEKGLSQNTLSAYKQDIKSFLSWLNDRSISLSEISLVIAEDFIKQLTNDKKSPSSINRKISALKGLYRFLIEAKVVDSNPFADVIL